MFKKIKNWFKMLFKTKPTTEYFRKEPKLENPSFDSFSDMTQSEDIEKMLSDIMYIAGTEQNKTLDTMNIKVSDYSNIKKDNRNYSYALYDDSKAEELKSIEELAEEAKEASRKENKKREEMNKVFNYLVDEANKVYFPISKIINECSSERLKKSDIYKRIRDYASKTLPNNIVYKISEEKSSDLLDMVILRMYFGYVFKDSKNRKRVIEPLTKVVKTFTYMA